MFVLIYLAYSTIRTKSLHFTKVIIVDAWFGFYLAYFSLLHGLSLATFSTAVAGVLFSEEKFHLIKLKLN